MGQQEVQRRSSAIENDGVQQVAKWSRGDQPSDCLVLVQGLPRYVRQQACTEQCSEPDERERRPEGRDAAHRGLVSFACSGAQGREP
jgi:hypothetical protein